MDSGEYYRNLPYIGYVTSKDGIDCDNSLSRICPEISLKYFVNKKLKQEKLKKLYT